MRYVLAFLALVLAVLMASTAFAQVSLSISFNVDRQPIWGPTGYDHVDYYYLPDLDVYYNVPQHKFYYSERGRWRSKSSLPSQYRGHDLYNSYKVVVNEPNPWKNDAMYKDKYASYKGRHDQESIRDSRDQKYFVNAQHPEHKNWLRQQRQHRNEEAKGNARNGSRR
jgi:hypothetical protein